MKSTNPDNVRYDRAEKLLAQNVEALGLDYAASLFYLDIAESRRDVRLVGDAVGALERLLRRDGCDQMTLRDGFLVRAEITGLARSEEHTSELQSRPHLVCRLLLEKKKI